MNQRVDEGEWIQYQWPYMLRWLGGEQRVNDRAYETGAFVRRRKFDSPSDVLQLLLMWAVAECPLRVTAALGAELGVADVSNVGLLKRFARAESWLMALLSELLANSLNDPIERNTRIRVIDATAISRRGSRTTDLRVHMAMQVGTSRTDTIELTDGRGSESLNRFTFEAGEIVLADKGYAHRDPLARLAATGAYFVVPLPYASLPLETVDGKPFDLFGALRRLPEAGPQEIAVRFRPSVGAPVNCRLVVMRKSEAAAETARGRVRANSKRHGAKIDPRTLEFAGFFCILTNAPAELSALSVLNLYRFRWQIEMKFKSLKTQLHLADVPTQSPKMLRINVLAKLLVAVVIENLLTGESFFPWGYPIQADQLVASHEATA
jgi:hypothetical protein